MIGGWKKYYITTFDGQKWKGQIKKYCTSITTRKGTYCYFRDFIYYIDCHQQVCMIDPENFTVKVVDKPAEELESD